MAPEVVAGIGYDKAVDIFSLGVIMVSLPNKENDRTIS